MDTFREFNPSEELITAQQIEVLLGLSPDSAEREFQHTLQQLGTGSSEMLFSSFCDYQGIDSEEAFACLNPPEETWTKELEDFEIKDSDDSVLVEHEQNIERNGSTIDH